MPAAVRGMCAEPSPCLTAPREFPTERSPRRMCALSSPMWRRAALTATEMFTTLSCLQKSIRGSDPDAAVFYLARLLEGGDLLSPCRRLLVIASEDIGQAYPMAAAITYACVESAKALGLPEARIPLANAAVMLATAPKSNTAYCAVNEAAEDIKRGRGLDIPEHLKSPLFKGYVYPHDFPNDWTEQQYLPSDIRTKRYYRFGENKNEQAAKAYWEKIKGKKL